MPCRLLRAEAKVSGEQLAIEDAAVVSLQFANGMIGSLHTGFFMPGDSEISIGVRGSLGWARWEVAEERCTIKSTHPSWATAPVRTFGVPKATVPGYGPEGLALMKAFASQDVSPPLEMQERTLNGEPAIVAFQGGRALAAVLVSVADGQIRHVFIQIDTDRLQHVGSVH